MDTISTVLIYNPRIVLLIIVILMCPTYYR
jgi:hypothetical protein